MVEFADGDEVLKAIRSAYTSGDQALEENNMANAALPKKPDSFQQTMRRGKRQHFIAALKCVGGNSVVPLGLESFSSTLPSAEALG